MTTRDPAQRLMVSSRDPEELRERLGSWLDARLAGANPEVVSLRVPPGNGMSSETVLLDARWRDGAGVSTHSLVTRIAAREENVPVYPVYDVARQFRVMAELGALDVVPVPSVRWVETDHAVLGSAFLVMDRVDGVIPPDMPPYTFSGWLVEASDAQRAVLRRESLRVLAALHAAPAADPRFRFLELDVPGDTPLRRHVAAERAYYEWVVSDGARSPLIEAGFTWLEEHWPRAEGEPVVTWGDARIGNIIYRDFRPVAMLDWETPALAPAEVDLGWFIWLHWTFQDFAVMGGLAGLPDLFRVEDVVADYVHSGGREPGDLHWYLAYAAVRHSIVMSRVGRRMMLFGERDRVAHIDDLLYNGPLLRRVLDGEMPAWA